MAAHIPRPAAPDLPHPGFTQASRQPLPAELDVTASLNTMAAPPTPGAPPTAANSGAATRLPSATASCGTNPTRDSGHPPPPHPPRPNRDTAHAPGRPQPPRAPHRRPLKATRLDYGQCCHGGNKARFVSEPGPRIPVKQGHPEDKISPVHTGFRTTSTPVRNVTDCTRAVRVSRLPSPG